MEPIHFTIHRLDTGEIVCVQAMAFAEEHRAVYRDAALAPWGAETHGLLEVFSDPARHYVATLGGQPVREDRPALRVSVDKTAIAADGLDAATLTGLPNPCEVVVDADDPDADTVAAEVAGGGFEFAAEVPGTYAIEVRRFPFLPFRQEIVAT